MTSFVVIMMAVFAPQVAKAQVVLYMEIMTELKPIKYYEGQELMFKSVDYPDEWRKIKIGRILDEEQIILFDGGMLKLDDIIQIRRTRPWAIAAGYMLQTFGVAWFGFGGIAHFTTSTFDFGVDTLVIGGTAIVSGWLVKKLFQYKKYKIGKKVRLKILDISWPEPRG
ncbi:MAG: hypothetical protein P1U56_19275 [Saprospiraceae bacterium]|nr:hypothetical protein [Saprospiraceae bacterium]